jgi:hypothetical protein
LNFEPVTLLKPLRHVVRVRRLLRGAKSVGHVLEIDADASPSRKPPPHRVNEDVGRFEVGSSFRVPYFPPLESGKHFLLLLAPTDFEKRKP